MAGSIAILAWSIWTPVQHPEVAAKPLPPSPTVNEPPVIQTAELATLLTKRLQGKPAAAPQVQTNLKSNIVLPATIKLEAILFGGEASVATFSVQGQNEKRSCVVGESFREIKIVAIEKDKVKVKYKDAEFEMKLALGGQNQ